MANNNIMVFTQVFCRLIIVSIVIIFSSCSSYRIFQVDVLQPSKIHLGENKRVALLYRNTHLKNNAVKFVDKSIELHFINDFEKGLNHTFMDVSYDTIHSFSVAKESHTIKTDLLPLPTDSIKNLYDQFNVDYIISLEMVHHKIQYGILKGYWFLRLYESDKTFPIDSIVLEHVLPEFTSFYNDNSDVLLEDIRVAFWDKGAEYARRIVPSWAKTGRRVYNQGKVLAVGDLMLKNGNIEQAINIWKTVSKLSNKKAIKANINLAWVYENSGDFDTALEFLLYAEEIAKQENIDNKLTIYLQEYLKRIKQRIADREIFEFNKYTNQ